MIELHLLNRHELEGFLSSPEFKTWPFLPISKHRALSHLRNPALTDDDTLLILAMENDKMLGYLGILPCRIQEFGVVKPFSWLSCMWVDPATRGRGIAAMLLARSYELGNNRIVVSEFVPKTIDIYLRSGLFNVVPHKGIRLYCRLDLQAVLPPRHAVFRKIKPLLKVADATINFLLDIRYFFAPPKPEMPFEYVATPDDEVAVFIEKRQKNQVFIRDTAEMEWIIKYPWILPETLEDGTRNRYYFSSFDKRYETICVKMRDKEGKLIAFVIFARRNCNLKIPYAYFDAKNTAAVAGLISYHLHIWRISTFSTYNRQLSGFFSEKKPFTALFRKEITRKYLYSKFLPPFPENWEVQDGSGDCAFT